MTARIGISEIKAAAQEKVLDVVAALGIKEAPRGRYIHICNPVAKDRHPSFTIWTQGAVGSFKDHRGIAAGDIIDLVAYLKGWSAGNDKRGRDQALAWLADFCGLKRLTTSQRATLMQGARLHVRQATKKRAEDLATAQGRAFQLWLEGHALQPDTQLWHYLTVARGIPLYNLPRGPRGGHRMPGILRFLPHHKHTESGRSLPCMLAGCVNGSGDILAVHRTWLAPDGRDKADVAPVKKVWPDFSGLVIPLWRGESNLPIGEAIGAGLRETLVLTEGVEDGLTAILAAPQYRTWAFISLGNLANVKLPECIDAVILHRQNEWHNGQAVAAFDKGKRALEAQGAPVIEVLAMIGKDLNDTQRGAA